MGFVKNKNFNILFIVVVFILMLLNFNTFNRYINAYINGEPPPKRLIRRTLDSYFEK
jgi:hypothetical protein